MIKYFLLFFLLSAVSLLSQHLPLQIGNQWHYNQGLGPIIPNAAFAVDTVRINETLYYKIEYREAYTGNVFKTTYDRIEGDSLYYRYQNGTDRLLFNFNWQDGQVVVTPWSEDTTCFLITIISRYPVNYFGVPTEYYLPVQGIYCPLIGQDTAWALSGYTYLKYFGSLDTQDGLLIGAVINGTTYGVLHPLPVELISFTADVSGNDVILGWVAATETNNKGFEIERQRAEGKEHSAEGIGHGVGENNWELIGFVEGNGTTTSSHAYSFKDKNVQPGKYYYRLKQIDFDGSYEYSKEIEVNISAPLEYSLAQNYPNPFNPVTTIKYSIGDVGTSPAYRTGRFMKFVQLKVYNTLGEEVETLVNEQQPAGSYEVKFDGSTLPGGVYIYRLSSGNYSKARKLILLK